MNVEISIDPSARREDGLAAISVCVPDMKLDYDLDLSFTKLYQRCGVPDAVTFDFLLLASLCYVIDKIVPRKSALDRWTRELAVEFPVSSPEVWGRVVGDLETALRFLSGDEWQVSFRKSNSALFRLPLRRRSQHRRIPVPGMGAATAVCLFSGGLDSLTGAIDLLAGDDAQTILLVGHYDVPGPASQQESLSVCWTAKAVPPEGGVTADPCESQARCGAGTDTSQSLTHFHGSWNLCGKSVWFRGIVICS
jgi:hypothetical protein